MASSAQQDPDPALAAETQVPTIYGLTVTLTALSTVVVALRFYTRLHILGNVGSDDATIGLAQVLSIAVAICTCFEARFSLGRHVWVVDPADTVLQLQFLYAAIVLYNVALNVIKFSLLLQYRRIFGSNSKLLRRVCLAFMAYVAVWMVAQVTLLGIACVPVMYVIPSAADHCLDTLPIWYLSSGMNIFTDFSILLIPIPSVLKLQLRRKQKLMLLAIFCLGFFTCIISIIRIFTLRIAIETQDPTWDNVGAAIWSVVELNCAILCSSLPTLRPLLARFMPGMSSAGDARAGQSTGDRHEMYGRITSNPAGGQTATKSGALSKKRQSGIVEITDLVAARKGAAADNASLPVSTDEVSAAHASVTTKTLHSSSVSDAASVDDDRTSDDTLDLPMQRTALPRDNAGSAVAATGPNAIRGNTSSALAIARGPYHYEGGHRVPGSLTAAGPHGAAAVVPKVFSVCEAVPNGERGSRDDSAYARTRSLSGGSGEPTDGAGRSRILVTTEMKVKAEGRR